MQDNKPMPLPVVLLLLAMALGILVWGAAMEIGRMGFYFGWWGR